MSNMDEEQGQTEYRAMRLSPELPATLSGAWDGEVNVERYHVILSIRVLAWPNDWDNFMMVQRLAVQVMHEFNRSFRGYADAHRNSPEDDIPF